MKRSEMIKFLVLRTLGNFLVLFTLFGFFATFGPALNAEIIFRLREWKGIQYTVAKEKDIENAVDKILPGTPTPTQKKGESESILSTVLSEKKEQILVPPDTHFSIVIPKIGAASKIQENVDYTDENDYLTVLQHAVAHAKGTAFPGYNGNIYLFAHSADNWWNVGRYNAVFYLLKELKPGDEVVVFFLGKRYNYIVSETQIIEPEDTSHITTNYEGGETLILQTCWPPGTTWKRLLVFAKPK